MMYHIIRIFNKYNIKFQNQKASVSSIKTNINECYYSLLDLVSKPSTLEMSISELLNYDWEDTLLQEKLFMNPSEFICNLSYCISSKFKLIEELEKETREGFSFIFMDFVGKMLNLLKDYLPFNDKFIDPVFKKKN